jgi:hypothetical protein
MASIFGGLAGALAQRLEGQLTGQQQAASLGMNALMMQNNLRKSEAEIEKDQADTALTRHKNLSPVFGEDGYNTAKFGEANAEGYGKLASAIAQAKAVGDIDTANKLRTMAVQQGYDLTKIDRESSDALGRQQQQQGFTVNQEIPARANADYVNQSSLLRKRLSGELFNKEAGDVFTSQFSVPSNILHRLNATPTAPTAPAPSFGAPAGNAAAPSGQSPSANAASANLDPVAAQRAHYDAAAQALLSSNPSADPVQTLGARP